jgi:hypothetical protein
MAVAAPSGDQPFSHDATADASGNREHLRDDAGLQAAASVSFLLALPHQLNPSQVDLKVLVYSYCTIDPYCLMR